MENVSLKSAAVWLPETFETAEYIASETAVPVKVVKEKMGIIRKCRALKDLHPGEMAVNAAKIVLEGVDPLSIDMVIWTGSEYKDYIVWTAGIYLQKELGLKNAFAFDISARCGNKIVGMEIARSMMLANPKLKRVLLAGGHKTGDLVNYKDPNARFLNNLADGGSAVLLERGDENPIYPAHIITDGEFTHDVIVPFGGTKNPAREGVRLEDTFLKVPDIEGMRVRLEQRSISNFLKAINFAKDNSELGRIDYLSLLHMKKSAHDEILKNLELNMSQSIYLDHYGHFGAPDQILSLGLAEKRGLLKKGDHVVFASAGIGYMWCAMSMRFDHNTFHTNSFKDYSELN